MLGYFVESSYIAFYQIAFNLITAASVILSFMGGALLPVLSRENKKESEKLFKKSRLILALFSFIAIVFTLFVSKYLITFIYGSSYLPSVIYLQFFSILLFTFPMIELYVNFYTSRKRTKVIAVSLIISTVINVILNFFLIKYGLSFSMESAVLGACIATIISRFVYIGILSFFMKK
jgi:O-antigen/teichoic acid export membrane protein